VASHVRPSVGVCPDCGKQRYETKRDAKAHSRRIKGRRSGRLHPYKCGGYWHFGHMPARVTAGDKTRNQIQPRRNR
jgi:hypothetical protein